VYKTNKVKKPINGKTLLAALQNYYKTDPKMAEDLTKHVLDSREEQIKETIKRKVDK
jgi:N12 class adenine-specific DNA methylase